MAKALNTISCLWRTLVNIFKLNSNRTFYLLCVILILSNIFLIVYRYPISGGDFDVYLGAVKAHENGLDPYQVENVMEYSGSGLPFLYPPISLPFFKIISIFESHISYFVLWTLLLTVTFLIIRKCDKDFLPLLLITILATGFITTYFNYLTGNVGLIELFLFSIAIYWILESKINFSGLFISLTSILKTLPILFGAPFLFAPLSKRRKLLLFSIIGLSFISIHVLSYLIYPDISSSYYSTIQSRNPFSDAGGHINPASFQFMKEISYFISDGNIPLFLILYSLYIGLIGVLFFNYMLEKDRKFNDTFFMGVLAVMLVIPRLKPYSYTIALLPIYFLIKKYDLEYRFMALLIISAAPLFFRITGNFSNLISVIIWNYNQLVCLFLIFVFILFLDGSFHSLKGRVSKIRSPLRSNEFEAKEKENTENEV